MHGTTVLRVGLALVFAYFSVMQFIDPEIFTSYLPDFLQGSGASLYLYLNATLDGLLALCFAFGVFPKLAPLVGAIHLLIIALTMGFNDVAVRDFGLAMACLSLVFIHEEHLSGKQRVLLKRLFGH
jgi:uncharacterized membrane protein YphA (DoxX/SURF4 family)